MAHPTAFVLPVARRSCIVQHHARCPLWLPDAAVVCCPVQSHPIPHSKARLHLLWPSLSMCVGSCLDETCTASDYCLPGRHAATPSCLALPYPIDIHGPSLSRKVEEGYSSHLAMHMFRHLQEVSGMRSRTPYISTAPQASVSSCSCRCYCEPQVQYPCRGTDRTGLEMNDSGFSRACWRHIFTAGPLKKILKSQPHMT